MIQQRRSFFTAAMASICGLFTARAESGGHIPVQLERTLEAPGKFHSNIGDLVESAARVKLPEPLKPGTYALELTQQMPAERIKELVDYINHVAPEGVRFMVLPSSFMRLSGHSTTELRVLGDVFPVDVQKLPVVESPLPPDAPSVLGRNTGVAFGAAQIDETRLAEAVSMLRAIGFVTTEMSIHRVGGAYAKIDIRLGQIADPRVATVQTSIYGVSVPVEYGTQRPITE